MAKKVNAEIVFNWKHGMPAENHRGSFKTDGNKLWSYNLLIGDTCQATGMKVLRDFTAKGRWGFKSQTTSCHVGLSRPYADLID